MDKYDVIEDKDLRELNRRINEKLDSGWQPQGGVTFVHDTYMQAMVSNIDLRQEAARRRDY